MEIKKRITEKYDHIIRLSRSGLVAIFVSARCFSKKQNNNKTDEDLRIEINGLKFREIPSKKNVQLFNIPPAWNGSKLKGLKKTVAFLTILQKGEHLISLIPKNSALVEDIDFKELSISSNITLEIEDQAEDGNRRPWYTFALIDLPLSQFSLKLTVEKRLWDSDDMKIIVDGRVKRNIQGGKYKFWYISGSILKWLIFRSQGESKKVTIDLIEDLDRGIHYLEFYADKLLEDLYPKLDTGKIYISFPDYNIIRVERLKAPFTNIRYVAAKIHFSQTRWEKAGFDISNKPEILGTLYNIEEIDKPITPHFEPQPNEFGNGVKGNYLKVKKLLGL